MNYRKWIFKPWIVGAILAGLIVYELLAEAFDLHLFGTKTPGQNKFKLIVLEGLVLWLFACMATGLTLFALKRYPSHDSTTMPLIVIPLPAVLTLSGIEAWNVYLEYIKNANSPALQNNLPFDVVHSAISISLPLFLWGLISIGLSIVARGWRNVLKPGVCPTCQYNLTGNKSGVCPECGQGIVTDPSIPPFCYGQRFLFFPDLKKFPNAQARYAAFRRAKSEYRRTISYWFTLIAPWPPLVLIPYRFELLGEQDSWMLFVLAFAVILVTVIVDARMMRRSLRRQLSEYSARAGNNNDPPRSE